jgi:transcription initiation factor TFIIIB Brf1 subunit/transcription initiation factor TFIIB
LAHCRDCRSNNIVFDTLKSGDKAKVCLDCGIVVVTKAKTPIRKQFDDKEIKEIKSMMGMDKPVYTRKNGAVRRK